MSPGVHQFLSLDLPAMLAGTFAVLACALLGNFLLLRKQSLMGDAISHAVLPGLVGGFLITGSRGTLPMFLGAAAAGFVTVILIELVQKLGRVEAGAAMGVVFSILFALGVVLIEQAAARGVDLDPDCVLNGQLERIFWFPPETWQEFLRWGTLKELPREVVTLATIALVSAGLIVVFFKELRIVAFDPALATSVGINATVVRYGLMVLIAAAVVASFEAVGSILVVAMLVCPAATARLLTDRLAPQVWISGVLALVIGIGGYLLAAYGPAAFGNPHSLSAAGMMTVAAGTLLFMAIIGAPHHGLVSRALRRAHAAADISREDLLADLYRAEETGEPSSVRADSAWKRRAVAKARGAGQIVETNGVLLLTPSGRDAARAVVRAHRLWETYLVDQVRLEPDHVHDTAMRLEHVTDAEMEARLAAESRGAPSDPHGKPIPPRDAPPRR